jgi:hypothetical protein
LEYGLDDRDIGVQFLAGARDFFSTASTPALRPNQPPIHSVPEAKRQRRETDHSSTSSADVKIVELHLHFPVCLHGKELRAETLLSIVTAVRNSNLK